MREKRPEDNELAVKYLGRTLLVVVIGIVLYGLASLGYNTYISVTKEKIEVHAENSNSVR